MSITTIRPTSTGSNSFTLTGASAHVATNDDSDATYITGVSGSFSSCILGFSGFTLASGYSIKQVRVRVRYKTVAPGTDTLWYIVLRTVANQAGLQDAYQTVSTTAFVDATGAWRNRAPDGSLWTAAAVNGLLLNIYPGLFTTSNQQPRVFEVYVDVEINANPVCAVDLPVNGGTITTTTRPQAVLSYTDPESDPVEGYRGRLFTSAQYGIGGFDPNVSPASYDSGKQTIAQGNAITPNFDLTNGAVYRWYGWVYQLNSSSDLTGPGVSAPVYSQFTMNVTPPAVPTITVGTPGNGTVPITVASGGGTPTTSTVTLERSTDAGVTWTVVRGFPQVPGAYFDYEAVPNRAIIYRAKAFTNAGVASAYTSSTSPITIVDNDWRLKDVINLAATGNNTLYNLILTPIGSSMKATKAEDKALFSPLGRRLKVSVADVIKGIEFSLTLDFIIEADYLAFERFRNLQRTLLIVRGWTGDQWYVQLDQSFEIETFSYTPAYRTVVVNWIEADVP